MTFEKFCKRKRITLKPWQKKAANAFLKELYEHRPGRDGKTFLTRNLDEFLSRYGNDFNLETD